MSSSLESIFTDEKLETIVTDEKLETIVTDEKLETIVTDEKLETIDILFETDDETLKSIFLDGNQEIENRIKSIVFIKNDDLKSSLIYDIVSMFNFTPTYLSRQLIMKLVHEEKIHIMERMKCCQSLYEENKNIGYEHFLVLCNSNLFEVDGEYTIFKIDVIRTLMETTKYYDETLGFLIKIVSDKKIDVDFRYKTIITILRDTNRIFIQKYIDDIYSFIIFNYNVLHTRHRIYSAQYLLNSSIDPSVKCKIENIIISFAKDIYLDYNIRADAADLLIRQGSSSDSIEIGRNIISQLGTDIDKNGLNTLYNDRQNIHEHTIDNSIKTFLLELASITSIVKENFDNIIAEIELIIHNGFFVESDLNEENTKSTIEKVRSSLYRISIDNTLYSGDQMVQSIFCKIWSIINNNSDDSYEMKKRMIEELSDMADTCTTGHVSRIVNAISGFEINGKTFNIDIGWKKQIQSNFLAKINLKIQKLTDLDYQSLILDELISKDEHRPNLSKFIITELQTIRDEMINEFENYLSDSEFDEYFRNAVEFFKY